MTNPLGFVDDEFFCVCSMMFDNEVFENFKDIVIFLYSSLTK